jgi:alpha-amylase
MREGESGAMDLKVIHNADGSVRIQAEGATSNAAPMIINTATLIPVNFSVSGTPQMESTDVLMLTGNVEELGNGATTWDGAAGPMAIPPSGNPILTVSLPAGQTVQFNFFILHNDGSTTMESGPAHSYTVPTSGTGNISVNW